MLNMVIEKFNDAEAVYRPFREKGRMLPEGLNYLDSCAESNHSRCFQLIECDNVQLFQHWIANWQDFVDFEIVEVVRSKDAAATYDADGTSK
jgi:hypothetical protein